MICEKCGNHIHTILTNVFNYDGSDSAIEIPIVEYLNSNAIYFETDKNWVGYDLSEEEINDRIECPICHKNPFLSNEVQMEELIRVIKFTK